MMTGGHTQNRRAGAASDPSHSRSADRAALATSPPSFPFRVVRGARTADELLALSLYTSFLTFVLFAMGEPILFMRYGWAPVAVLLALRVQQRRTRHVDA
jgi:hypothetical protein